MTSTTPTSTDPVLLAHRAGIDALRVAGDATDVRALPDATLLELGRLAAQQRQLADTTIAAVAGELLRRSDPALGKDGLARRSGFRTPDALVQELTGSSKHAALRDLQVGRVLTDAGPSGENSWLSPVREAMLDGAINADQAAVIVTQLGTPDESVTSELLESAAGGLVAAAGSMHADRVRELAREIRNDLDLDRVADREAALVRKRSARVFRNDDGTWKLLWIMDPETAAVVTSIVDRATSPRLGGPRFVDDSRADQAERIVKDARTTEQLASDVLRDLLSAGATLDADGAEHLLLQVEQPAVKILVTADALATHSGSGHLEGSGAEVSMGTVERARCTGTSQTLRYTPTGTPLDVGRTQRLFTRQQREILAAMWGGCAIPWCTRPPSWCEYHHLRPWAAGGGTSADNGILLCRCHHQDLHNNDWKIRRTAEGLQLRTPDRPEPIPLTPKSRTWRRLSTG